ncbi:MAG: VWA domain-containing protein [Endomicrobiales bacterium]|nr:VWA domain-containing protein [Endomicrobiales bacterium]
MIFAHPYFLLLLIALGIYIFIERKFKLNKTATIYLPQAEIFKSAGSTLRAKLSKMLVWIKVLAIALIIVALARPQAGQNKEEVYNQGIDIMLVMDTSSSMQALDFQPDDRLQAAKKVAKEFVKGRTYDRIGIVVFSGLAFTQCPLTIDHDAVLNFLDKIETNMTGVDGTAIGSAIATAASRLKASNAKSKVIILVTDGRNNMGEIDPISASKAALAMGIKIYTIGAAKPGESLYPIDDPVFGRRLVKIENQDLDEATLANIAGTTNGRYFRATDTNSLSAIFKQIDNMEKTKIKALKYTDYKELFAYFLWPTLLLLLGSKFLNKTYLRKLP